MKKPFRFLITFILLVSISSAHTIVYSQPYGVTQTLQGYIDRSQGLLNQVYYLGKTTLANVMNQTDNSETSRIIQLNLNQVNALERDVLGYIQSIEDGTLESRNAITLHIALHHFAMALEELNNFLRSTDSNERFNILERYFYDTVTATENINRLRQQTIQ